MDALASTLAEHALMPLGQAETKDGCLVLIGPDEPAFWTHFSSAPEASDGEADPLDRWSQRVLDAVARDHDAQALYPFGGPPWAPFHTWALATGRFWTSPIGFLVHDTAGLFVSFRGALLFKTQGAGLAGSNPCPTCTAPCTTACPVDAFASGYDVAACKAHLRTSAGQDCVALGCRARRACPVGQGHRLPSQAAFHMKAFL